MKIIIMNIALLNYIENVNSRMSGRNWKKQCVSSHNIKQNIVTKFTKLSRAGFSTEYCTGQFFCNFLTQLSISVFCATGKVLIINSKHFIYFFKVS